MQRNVGIEILRALAIISVVQIHCLRPYFIAAQSPMYWEEGMRTVIDFATPSFFFISGYLTPRQGQFLLKRLRRIIIPYCIASAMKICLLLTQAVASRKFWSALIFELQLRNLEDPNERNCVLHERLVEEEGKKKFEILAENHPASLFPFLSWGIKHFALGTPFGHYYFVPALVQLHCIVSFLAPRIEMEATWSKLIFVLAACYLIRSDFTHMLGLSDHIAWRLPFLWAFYFFHGFYGRHFIAAKKRYRRKYAVVLMLMVMLSLPVALISLAYYLNTKSKVSKRLSILSKDVYIAALPAAICLLAEDYSLLLQRVQTIPLLAPTLALLTRFSYSIYLYHGHVLDFFPHRFHIIMPITFSAIWFIDIACKSTVSTRCFGIIPLPDHHHTNDEQISASSAHQNSGGSLPTVLDRKIYDENSFNDAEERPQLHQQQQSARR